MAVGGWFRCLDCQAIQRHGDVCRRCGSDDLEDLLDED